MIGDRTQPDEYVLWLQSQDTGVSIMDTLYKSYNAELTKDVSG